MFRRPRETLQNIVTLAERQPIDGVGLLPAHPAPDSIVISSPYHIATVEIRDASNCSPIDRRGVRRGGALRLGHSAILSSTAAGLLSAPL